MSWRKRAFGARLSVSANPSDFQADHPLKKGYPEGHAHLAKFLTVPVFDEDQIVAVVAVANKVSDYDETDVLQLTLFMDAVWKSVDIKMSEEKLRESEEKIHLLLNSVAEAIYGIDLNGNCTFCNPPCLRLLGYNHPEALLGKNMHWQIHSKHPDGTHFPIEECRIFQAFKKGEGTHADDEVLWRSDGTSFPVEYWSYPQRQGDVIIGAVVTFLDITERKLTDTYREMGIEILQILSKPDTLHDSMQSVLAALKIRTGFDAVGIRLQDGDDFPYFAQNGFSDDFLLTENTLIERGKDGGLCRNKDGNVSLECTCGLVISGKTDPTNPLFTKGGSSWTNDSFPFLDLPSDQDPRLHPRNKCIHQGYASVALVPIRNKDSIIGLIQFNDRRKNCFSLTAIEQFEAIASHIGEALLRKQAESQREAALEALRESEERIHAITNSAKDAITMMDNNGNISYWNPAAEYIFGYTSEEAIGRNLHELISPERFLSAHLAAFPEFQKTGRGNAIGKTLDLSARRKDGREIDVALSLSAVKIEGTWHSVGIIHDITERKRTEEQIKHLATHDLLTDLPSLGLARDRMSSAINMARRYKKAVALMFVDLDAFKAVNDTLGHDAGDYVLKQVALRLLSCVRDTDTVARVGGDEFLIIATEINSPENAVQIAEKVIQTVSQPVIFNGQQAFVGTSIGIALFPDNGEDMDQLIKLADEAMYKVKNAGKNGFRFVNTTK
jgi:diguanylate cyclase (GGDEF)-like protein/PAS domain S-box-containing protein